MGLVVLLTVAGAVAPAAFLLHFVYARDKYEPEPVGLVLRVYFLSYLTVVPALIVEIAGVKALGTEPKALVGAAALAFVVVGGAEEGSKYVFLRWLAFRRKEFDEPYDGIVYAVAVGLGFATVENVAYVFAAPDVGSRAALVVARAFTSVPVHALLGVIMGFYVGRAKFAPDPGVRGRLLWLGFLVPALSHGVYDFPLLAIQTEPAGGVSVLLLLCVPVVILVLWVTGVRMIHRAQADSPFKRPNPLVQPLAAANMAYKYCTECGARAPRSDAFCRACGASWQPLRRKR